MPAGHLNPNINERKKLTPGMRSMMKAMSSKGLGPVHWKDCSNGEKNQLRALMDRGYAKPVGDEWKLTREGELAYAALHS